MGAGTDKGALPTPPASRASQTNKIHLCRSAKSFLEPAGENRGAEAASPSAPPCPSLGLWPSSFCVRAFPSSFPL